MSDRPIRGKCAFARNKCRVLFAGGVGTCINCSSLLNLYKSSDDNANKQYIAVAGCLALLRLTIMCIAYGACVVKERTGIVDEDDTRIRKSKPVKASTNVLIGLAMVVVLLAACLEFAYVPDYKSDEAEDSIVGSVIGSFAMTEFLYMLQIYGVIHPVFRGDLGYFKFMIAAALCAFYKIYGFGKLMAFPVLYFMTLNLASGATLKIPDLALQL